MDGTLETEVTEEPAQAEAEETTTTEQAVDEKAPAAATETDHQFDKQRQQEQQELGNARRRISELEQSILDAQAAPKAEPDDGDEDPLETIKILKSELAEVKDKMETSFFKQSVREEKVAYDEFLVGMKKEYGDEFTNNALQHAREEALRLGFSLNGRDHPTFDDLIKIGFLQAGGASTPAETTPRAKVKNAPKADVGKTGSATQEADFHGTPDDVLADMRKRGRFKGYEIET